jgi:hypothetical protein
MAARTFESFLLSYCNELAGIRTVSVKRLFAACVQQNSRIAEPLFVYAALVDKLPQLLNLAQGTAFDKTYSQAFAQLQNFADTCAFLQSPTCPKRFCAVYDAWLAPSDKLAANRRIAAALRPKILTALDAANVTRYKLCKDLNLNMGNVYAYLAGNDEKVSRQTAQRMLNYAQNAECVTGSPTRASDTFAT